MQTFKGIKFDNDFLKKFEFDQMVDVDFTLEDEDLLLPSNLDKALRSAIIQMDIVKLDPLTNEVVRLIDLYRSLFNPSAVDSQKSSDSKKGQAFAELVKSMHDKHMKALAQQTIAEEKSAPRRSVTRQDTPGVALKP